MKKNDKKTLGIIIVFLLMSLSVMAQNDSLDYDQITELFTEYEKQLVIYHEPVPCDCSPCAMYCYKEAREEPDYNDFKQWLKEKYNIYEKDKNRHGPTLR